MAGKLLVVATPIGNLEDITIRTKRVLAEVDFIVAEDSRVTRKLLNLLNLPSKEIVTFHQHSTGNSAHTIIKRIEQGSKVALVTDAGTPGLSDPGNFLVAEAVKTKIEVVPIPGASALTATISVAGLDLTRFVFYGFLPHKKGRQTLLKKIAESDIPVIIFESVHRINKLLQELVEYTPGIELVVARELTKIHETIYRGQAKEILEQLTAGQTKGEFVVIIDKS